MDNEKKIGILGLIIFCVGLGLLIFVFYLAYLLFQDPTLLVWEEMGMDLSQFFTNILYASISLVALAIMGGVAGKIASKGIEFFKSRKG